MVTPDEDDNNNNNDEKDKEKEKETAMMMMGGRTLSLITEEDMLLEFEQMQKKMNLSKKKNLTIRVEPRDGSIGDGKNDKKNASNTKDGSDSHRSSSTNNEDEDEAYGSPTDLENTVHLTDKFLTDRSMRSGETTRVRFSEDASSRGTTFAAASQKGLGRKEREDTFSVSIFDGGKM